MDEGDWLAEEFEAHRRHLRAVALRMLGSSSEADDAVQEAWLRLRRTGADDIGNLGGWLTTVVSRVCLDMLRSRAARREDPLAPDDSHGVRATQAGGAGVVHLAVVDPEQEAVLADSVGMALQVVLDTLAPAERLAFVLHDLFGVPFDEIAPIVNRSPDAARQLASRARRRVQGAGPDGARDPGRQRDIVDAFLAAARGGNFDGLLALLDPDVVLRADGVAVRLGASAELRGAAAVAETFAGRARVARLALVNGAVGAVWAPGGETRVAFDFTVTDGKVVAIDIVADPDQLAELGLELLDPA